MPVILTVSLHETSHGHASIFDKFSMSDVILHRQQQQSYDVKRGRLVNIVI